jgi:hypothetical protein
VPNVSDAAVRLPRYFTRRREMIEIVDDNAVTLQFRQMVRSGEIRDYGQLARLGHISPARLTQIMVLLHLAPAIQEYILFLSPADARFVSELGLRQIAREPRWDRQRELFEQFLQNGLACVRRQRD